MDQKQGIPSDQPPMGYPAQAPPAYPGQSPVAGQQPQGYPVQAQPGYPGQPQPGQVVIMAPAEKMNNNLVLAIIATLCCCPIFGIVGIVYAAQVDSAFFRGDVAKAQDNANNAKRWSIAAIVFGCVWIVIVIILRITVASKGQQTYE